jgi:hypothetical protein
MTLTSAVKTPYSFPLSIWTGQQHLLRGGCGGDGEKNRQQSDCAVVLEAARMHEVISVGKVITGGEWTGLAALPMLFAGCFAIKLQRQSNRNIIGTHSTLLRRGTEAMLLGPNRAGIGATQN